MKFLTFVFSLLCLYPSLKSQSIKPALSLTFIVEPIGDDPFEGYKESTLNFNIAYSLNKRHNFGLQYLDIRTAGSSFNIIEEKSRYFIAGAFYQYDFIKNSTSELYPEISINYGNYCTCGRLDPYEKAGLIYLGYGFGYDVQLYKNFFLDLGFHVYRPIFNTESEEYVYSFTQYILGISYKITGK